MTTNGTTALDKLIRQIDRLHSGPGVAQKDPGADPRRRIRHGRSGAMPRTRSGPFGPHPGRGQLVAVRTAHKITSIRHAAAFLGRRSLQLVTLSFTLVDSFSRSLSPDVSRLLASGPDDGHCLPSRRRTHWGRGGTRHTPQDWSPIWAFWRWRRLPEHRTWRSIKSTLMGRNWSPLRLNYWVSITPKSARGCSAAGDFRNQSWPQSPGIMIPPSAERRSTSPCTRAG